MSAAGRASRLLAVALISASLVSCGTARAEYIRTLGGQGSPGPDASSGTGTDINGEPTVAPMPQDPAPVGVQLVDFFGAAAAGLYNAAVGDFYGAAAVEVGIIPGTPDEDPIAAASAPDGPEFLLAPLAAVLRAREADGSDLVLIAQVFQRSGALLVGTADAPPTPISALEGSAVGLKSLGGQDLEVRALLAAAGLEPGPGYEPVEGYDFVADPSMVQVTGLLRSGAAAALQASTYDELPQLLEFGTEDGEAPFTIADLAVHSLDADGEALAGMGLFARASWLADPKNHATAVRFLAATFAGYADCREHAADCAQLVVDQGAALPIGHQLYAVNEVNALVWPAPGGIGSLDDGWRQRTVNSLVAAGLLAGPPAPAAFDLSIAAAARDASGLGDLVGATFVKAVVAITPGGEGDAPVGPDPGGAEEETPGP